MCLQLSLSSQSVQLKLNQQRISTDSVNSFHHIQISKEMLPNTVTKPRPERLYNVKIQGLSVSVGCAVRSPAQEKASAKTDGIKRKAVILSEHRVWFSALLHLWMHILHSSLFAHFGILHIRECASVVYKFPPRNENGLEKRGVIGAWHVCMELPGWW